MESTVGVTQLVLYSVACILLLVLHLFLLLVGYLVYIHSKYDHLPGPKRSSFFLGNAYQLGTESRPNERFTSLGENRQAKEKRLRFEVFHDWAEEYGDTYVLFLLHKVFVVTRDPEALKLILVHGDQRKFPKTTTVLQYIFGTRYMGDGLISTVDHDGWTLRRRALNSVFHRRKLLGSIDVFNVSADNFVKDLDKLADTDESFLLSDRIYKATLDVIMRSKFSMHNDDLNTEFHDEATRFVEVTFTAVSACVGYLMPSIDPRLRNIRYEVRKSLKSFRERGARIIRDRQKLMEKEGADVPDDFLTALISAYNDPSVGYTFEMMVDEFISILSAGMETTANTLSLLLMELSRQPEILRKLRQEVDEVLGNRDHVTNDDITKLSYTHQVIKETLRFYPPATMIARNIVDETTLTGQRIPSGTPCIIHIASANKNKVNVDKPFEFIPERFDPNSEKKIPVYSFLSFSLGPRNCIGQVFAQMEVKVMLARFIQRFRFEIDPSETYQLGLKATIYPISRLKGKIFARELHDGDDN